MNKTFNTTIQEFLAPRKFAMAGVSRNPKKFGYMAFKELKEKGFEIYPVNPDAGEILGVRCYGSLSEVPSDVNHLVSMVPKDQTFDTVRKALDRGISNIWIQQMSETPEAIDLALDKKAGLVVKTCILMHAGPVKGGHLLHRGLMKLFGLLPK
jgi:predicted CoA-binding protein